MELLSDSNNIKWTGHNTGINTILENRGAFEYKQYRDVFIFYDDGTLVFSNLNFDDTTRICPIPWPYDSINTSDVDWSSIYGTGLSWPPGAYYDTDLDQWDIGATGLYRLEGDTIYANLYWRNCFHFSFRTRFYFSTELWKLKFRVLDRTTIELCEKRYIDKEFPYPKICHDKFSDRGTLLLQKILFY